MTATTVAGLESLTTTKLGKVFAREKEREKSELLLLHLFALEDEKTQLKGGA